MGKGKLVWAGESIFSIFFFPLHSQRTFISFSSLMNVEIRPTIKRLRPREAKAELEGERSSMRQKPFSCMHVS